MKLNIIKEAINNYKRNYIIKKITKSNLKTIIALIISSLLISWIFFYYYHYLKLIKERYYFNWQYITDSIDDKWNKISNFILIDIIKKWDLNKLSYSELLKINDKTWYNYVKDHLLLTYYIYDKENINKNIITKEILNNLSSFDWKIIPLEKNSELGKKILKESPYNYNMFPLFVFDKRDKTFESINNIKKESTIKWDYLYLSEKYQIFSNIFYLTDIIKKEIIYFCWNDGLIIDNWQKENLIFIWKKSLNDFFTNINDLYSIDKNICYLDTEDKYYDKNLENRIFSLKKYYNNDYKSYISNENYKNKTLNKYFIRKDWVYVFENQKLIKINNLKTIIKQIKL